jgi:O-antigen ligase
VKERLVPVLVVFPLLLALPLAVRSLTVALALAGVAVFMIAFGLFGLDRTAAGTMVAAFALAPCVKFVFPGFRFFDLSDGLLIVAILLAVPQLVTRHIWLPKAFVLGSLAFVTIAVLASAHSLKPGPSYYFGARVVLAMIAIPALLVWWRPRGKFLVTLVLAYAAGTAVSVLVGLPQTGPRSIGLTGHPNVLGYTAMLTLSLVPFLAKALPKPYRTPVCAAVFVIAFLGIMTSGSRAALITALFLIVLVPAAERSIYAGLAVIGVGLVALLYVPQRMGAAEGNDALSRLLGGGGAEGSNVERLTSLEQSWAVAVDHPFLGVGFNFSDFFTHNAYVQIAADAGFLALAAFAAIGVSMVAPLFSHDDIHSRLVYPAVVFLFAAPVSPNLTDRYIGLLWGLSLVGVVAVHEARREREQDGSAMLPNEEMLTPVTQPPLMR